MQEMPVIRRAKEFILEHYRENISLQDVAEFCGVSVSYLSNLFHKQLGISYSKYLLKLRMDEASKLLSIYPDMKIYDVAERTGFITAKHFIAVFKKNFVCQEVGRLAERFDVTHPQRSPSCENYCLKCKLLGKKTTDNWAFYQ